MSMRGTTLRSEATEGAGGAVIYCRVSTREQAEEGVSLSSQEHSCREFCRRVSRRVEAVFTDRGESARDIDRPQFTEMITWCRRHASEIDSIVVYKLDRFSRNKNSFFAMQALLARYGIRVLSATEPLEKDTPVARLLEGILASIGEFESDLIAERTRTSMEHARRQGKPTTKAPLGYLSVRGPDGAPTFILDPERAEGVRNAFLLYATGLYTRRKVLARINASGLRTQKGNPVSIQTLSMVLRNPVYAGQLRVNGSGETSTGNFPPLVSQDLFDRVQRVYLGRVLHPGLRHQEANPDFPLRRFIRCGSCGVPLTGSWSRSKGGRRYPYYFCRTRGCSGVSIRTEKLETLFVEYLDTWKKGSERHASLSRNLTEWVNHWASERGQLEESLEAEIGRLTQRLDAINAAFLYEKTIDRATYDREREKVEALLVDLQLRRDDLQPVEAVSKEIEHALGLVGSASSRWPRTTLNFKRALQEALFPSGLEFCRSVGTFGTPQPVVIPGVCEFSDVDLSRLATPTGFEPVLPA
jgi:site-specific DNA recombinase